MREFLKLSCCSIVFAQFSVLGADNLQAKSPISDVRNTMSYERDSNGNYLFLGDINSDSINTLPSAFVAYLADESVELKNSSTDVVVSSVVKFIINNGVLGNYELNSLRAFQRGYDHDPRCKGAYTTHFDAARIGLLLNAFLNKPSSAEVSIGKAHGIEFNVIFKGMADKDSFLDWVFIPHEADNVYQRALRKVDRLRATGFAFK